MRACVRECVHAGANISDSSLELLIALYCKVRIVCILDSLESVDSTTASVMTFYRIQRLYILVIWQCVALSLRSKVCTMFQRNKPT